MASVRMLSVSSHVFLLILVSVCGGLKINIDSFKGVIMLMHNYYRSNEPASNMKQLTWDPNLERRAAEWADVCYWDHQRKGLGENLAYFWTSGPSMDTMDIILKSHVNWWKEVHDWTWSRHCNKACHYTQMIWAKTERVGCSLKKCPTFRLENGDVRSDAYYFVCFYDPPGNFIGEFPYKPGKACSRCAASESCTYGLCSKAPPTSGLSRTLPDPGLNNVRNNTPISGGPVSYSETPRTYVPADQPTIYPSRSYRTPPKILPQFPRQTSQARAMNPSQTNNNLRTQTSYSNSNGQPQRTWSSQTEEAEEYMQEPEEGPMEA